MPLDDDDDEEGPHTAQLCLRFLTRLWAWRSLRSLANQVPGRFAWRCMHFDSVVEALIFPPSLGFSHVGAHSLGIASSGQSHTLVPFVAEMWNHAGRRRGKLIANRSHSQLPLNMSSPDSAPPRVQSRQHGLDRRLTPGRRHGRATLLGTSS